MALSPGPDAAEKGASLSGPNSRYSPAKLDELKDMTVVTARNFAKRLGKAD